MSPPPPFGANSAAARDVANVLHPYTDLKAHLETGPMVVTHGKGVRIWDDTDKEYIEGMAGLWCAALGFDNERLIQAAAAQMRARVSRLLRTCARTHKQIVTHARTRTRTRTHARAHARAHTHTYTQHSALTYTHTSTHSLTQT